MKMQANHFIRSRFIVALAVVTLGTGAAMAAEDFTRYNNEELFQLRNQTQNMSEGDRLHYQDEMQNRTRDMTLEDRQRMRTSEDNDRGQGELRRERERTERYDADSHYGRGYEARQGGSNASGAGRGGMGGGGRGR